MNSSPFSLATTFHPKDAREDKIDLEIGGWEFFGIGSDAHTFKQYLSAPPAGSEEMAWKEKGKPLLHGWFFLRPAIKGKDRDKLWIRRQSLKNPKTNLRHEAPLCGGHCLFYQEKKPQPVTDGTVHRAKLRLSLNLQRFIRHQPKDDDPSLPGAFGVTPRLKERTDDRSFYEEEFSFDGQDNWLPNTPAWRKYAAQDHFDTYLNLVQRQVDWEFKRACAITNGLSSGDYGGWDEVMGGRGKEHYSLSTVETHWEFPSGDPIGDVFAIGQKLMHLKKEGGSARFYPFPYKETGRVFNSPCVTVPVGEGVRLKLYAKTNRRIRFEIVQTGLMRLRSTLLEEAKIDFGKEDRPLTELSPIVTALRQRAAKYLNQVMAELREGREEKVKACSVVDLLSEITGAVPAALSEEERTGQIQTLLLFLCYQRGFRGNVKTGPYAAALAKLAKRGVIRYDRSRQFYVLSPAYVLAADALIAATGDPALPIFSSDGSVYVKSGNTLLRIRE